MGYRECARHKHLYVRSQRWCFLAALILPMVGSSAALAAPLALEECVRLALARAPVVGAASQEARAAGERVRAAAAAYLPQFTARAEYGIARGFDEAITNGGATAALVGVAFPVLDGGFRAAQWQAAKARLQSSKALEQQRRADVAMKVRAAHLVGASARAQAGIQGDAARVLEEYVMLLPAWRPTSSSCGKQLPSRLHKSRWKRSGPAPVPARAVGVRLSRIEVGGLIGASCA